ncbi:hypothetical protein FRB94_001951 [Tulasnella sp. JGI-2019a]|nr:hypothetical protein FRB93_005762 [Tulasnella sp. JGI-2019a]KAG9004982.1 hypothetical protein FRB94_001951 [Tulasnella sp. JGI-2019a]KAG9038106.1 hypothetical protein FRB95_003034 [Tulasnella sp. JGI-2019a]
MKAILEAFPDPDLLPLSRSARKNLDEVVGEETRESEFSKGLTKELGKRLLDVVLQNCLPRMPVSEEESGSTT